MNKIKVVVVDDSALMRKIISDMLNEEEDIEVIKTCKNGQDLINNIDNLKPDVITLDVEMPILDGIGALRELKTKGYNIPVIMLSSVTQEGSIQTIESLRLGAFDFVPKPSGSISLDIEKVKQLLVEKIRAVPLCKRNVHSKIVRKPIETKVKRETKRVSNVKPSAVVIGASTGGPKALFNVITELPSDLGVPVFIVQHMPKSFTKVFAERLNGNSKLKVIEAEDGMKIEKNVVYIAKGGYHMEISKNKHISLNEDPSVWGVRPAVDKLFESATKVYGEKIVSALLTGMGKDGAKGTELIKDAGGITIAEDESTCVIYGMPKAAYSTGKVDYMLPLHKISNKIVELVKG